MPIALTSDQADLAAAVAGFTARHADIAATRAAFAKIASGGWRVTGHSAPVLGAASAQILILGAEADDAVHGGEPGLPR
jgi:hypothetical protein